jgi:hypothetical protein
MNPAVVVLGASAVAGAVASRRRRRQRQAALAEGGWQPGEYPSREELAARRERRKNTFSSGVDYTMGKIRSFSWLGGGSPH